MNQIIFWSVLSYVLGWFLWSSVTAFCFSEEFYDGCLVDNSLRGILRSLVSWLPTAIQCIFLLIALWLVLAFNWAFRR